MCARKRRRPYLLLILGDRTGEIDARMWDNAAEVMDTFDRDDFRESADCCKSIRADYNSRYTNF